MDCIVINLRVMIKLYSITKAYSSLKGLISLFLSPFQAVLVQLSVELQCQWFPTF